MRMLRENGQQEQLGDLVVGRVYIFRSDDYSVIFEKKNRFSMHVDVRS